MCGNESDSDGHHCNICSRFAEESLQYTNQCNGEEEGYKLNHNLIIVVLHAALTDEFGIQWHGLLVVDCHLKNREILETCREEGI